jgi:spermidine synthase
MGWLPVAHLMLVSVAQVHSSSWGVAPVVENNLSQPDFDSPFPLDNFSEQTGVTRRERTTLLISVLIISICALAYELIIATLSSYLLGDSVTQFSFTIGFFLFAMGIGALISRRIESAELRWFIIIEISIGLFGGTSAIILNAVFASLHIYYTVIMLLISMIIGICVGLEIPLLTRIVVHRDHLSRALSDILSIDYIGSLLASLAFPTFLLPVLGVNQTAFLMGLLNIGVAGMLLYTFGYRLDSSWKQRLWIIWSIVAGIMVLGSLFSVNIARFFEQQLYSAVIIYEEQTPMQRIIMTRDAGDDLRLFINGNIQFSSRDEYRYHEMLVHPVISTARTRETVLVLGGGDGLVARELLKYNDIEQIIIVDLDPAITNLAKTHPLLVKVNQNAMNDERVSIVNQDALKYLEESNQLFPVIIIDLPDPNNETLSKLYSTAFYKLVNQHLTRDGAFITQATSPYFVREAYWTIVKTIESSDFKVLPLRTHVPSFGEWGFVLGTLVRPPKIAMPEGIELKYLTESVLNSATLFDPDTDQVPAQINTLNTPILPRVYELSWRQWG